MMISSLFTFAQEGDTKNITLSEAQLYSGMNIYPGESLTLVEMNKFAPGSEILAKDYTGFYGVPYHTIYTSNSLNASLGLTFAKKPHGLFRIGINYSNRRYFSGGLTNTTSSPYDTLVSTQTGQMYFIDSSNMRNMSMSYNTDQIGLDLSMVYRTDPSARWSLHGGIGVLLSYSFNATTSIYYHSVSSISNYSGNTYGEVIYEYEHFRNKGFISPTVYLPLGIDFRVGKNRDFWNRIHLFYELRPSISFAFISEYGDLLRVNLTNGLGLRVTW